MICPNCKKEMGKNTFCEVCGKATVASDEITATNEKVEKTPFSLKRKLKKLSFSIKQIIFSIVIGILIIVGIIGYITLQAQFTPRKTVETFYNYIEKNNYDKAFKMIANTDNKFLTKNTFKIMMEQQNIKTYNIKNYVSNDFNGTNIIETANMFEVQANKKSYPVGIVQNVSILFYKNYKIDPSNFSTSWKVIAPKGSKILINGVQSNLSSAININNENSSYSDKYKPITDTYQIDKIFKGRYDITAKMDGAKGIILKAVQSGHKVTIGLNPNADTVKKLQGQIKTYLDLYYSNASQDKYKPLLTSDSDALSKQGSMSSSLVSVTDKLNDLKITSSQLDDTNHAMVSIKGTLVSNDSSMVQYGGAKQISSSEMTTDFYFRKVNGKWLICDTGYIN